MNKWDSIWNPLLKELITDIPLFYWWDNLYGTSFLKFALLKECKFKKKKKSTCDLWCSLLFGLRGWGFLVLFLELASTGANSVF